MILQEKSTLNNQFTDQDMKNDSLSCQYCDKPAICNIYTCYKHKQGNFDSCSNCEERLCQHHWRIYFRIMMK